MSESKKQKMQIKIVNSVLKLGNANEREISLRNIAECAGIKAPTIYYHFKNAREIAFKVWEKLTNDYDLSEYLSDKSELCEFLFFKKDSRLTPHQMNGKIDADQLLSIRRSLEENNND